MGQARGFTATALDGRRVRIPGSDVVPSIRKAVPLDGYNVRFTFHDGTVKVIDLDRYLEGGGVFASLRDPERFRELRVDPELGTIAWPNGVDFCPCMLYYGLRPASWEYKGPPTPPIYGPAVKPARKPKAKRIRK